MTFKFVIHILDAYYNKRTIEVTCETFSQAEKAAMENADIQADEQIVLIEKDWHEPPRKWLI